MTLDRMPRSTYLILRDQYAWLQRIEQQMGLNKSQILRMALTYAARHHGVPAFVREYLRANPPSPRSHSVPKSFTVLAGHMLFIDCLVDANTPPDPDTPNPANHSSVMRAILAFCSKVPVAALVNAANEPA